MVGRPMSDRLALTAIELQAAHDGKSCAVCVYVDRNLAAGLTCSINGNAPTSARNWCGVGGLGSKRNSVANQSGEQAELF